MTPPTPVDTAPENLLAAEFPVREHLIYLNHAGVAPLPRRSAGALSRFAGEIRDYGARDYPRWLEAERRLREQFRWLLNAPSTDDIALVKSTSEGLSFVAHGFPWRSGDQVVIGDQEFPSNRIVWESLAPRGVEVIQVPLAVPDPDQALLDALGPRARLLAVSAVQYGTGLALDLHRLGAACRARGVAFCVDAIQALGVLPVDVQAMHIDFLAADGHKWLLGPEGLGVFYCAPAWRERLALHEFGWHMVEHADDFDRRDWAPAATARRFECGSPNMLGVHALEASLTLFQELGPDWVGRRILALTAHLRQRLARHPELHCLSPRGPGRVAGITTLRHRHRSSEAAYRRLRAAGVQCALRGGGIRLSPHCYNREEELDQVIDLLLSDD